MAIYLPTRMLVIIVIALVLLAIGLLAVAYAGGLTTPLFEQIANLLGGLKVTG
jgi:hypothetical protein